MMVQNKRIAMFATMGVLMALALVLEYVDKTFLSFAWLQGGSISTSAFIIFVVGWRYKAAAGALFAGVYGFLTFYLFGGTMYSLIQVVLEYGLAFIALGVIAGLTPMGTSRWKLPYVIGGIWVACAIRLLIHTVAGIIFFAEYAPAGQAVWVYSLTYNGLYMVPNAILYTVLTVLLWPTLNRLAKSA